MKILVTGGSGVLGHALVKDLVGHGHKVHNVDRSEPPERGVAWFHPMDLTQTGELYDLFAQLRPDAVAHLAANPRPMGFPRNRQLMDNLGLTHAVLQVASDLGITRVAVASSEQANGWSSRGTCPPRIPFNEDDMTTPGSAYALSKLLGETVADSMAVQNPQLSITSLRVNFVAKPEWYAHWRDREEKDVRMSANLWAYVDARDAALSFRMALEQGVLGHHRFLVAAKDIVGKAPTRQLIRQHHGEAVEIAPDLPDFGSSVDCSRIREVLGWQPKHSWREE